jgi:fumarate reductase flavoprotein subunit
VLSLYFLAGCSSSAKTTVSFIPGTYTATATGMAGEFNISVTFGENTIDAITVGKNNETLMVGTEAIRILIDRILKNQSLDVDVVSTATFSSMALIAGVEDCVKQAGGDIAALRTRSVNVDTYDNLPHDADIIVVGGGISGMAAAIAAKQHGGNVILLEKRESVGGNAVVSTGTFLIGGTSVQKDLGITDDPQSFYDWVYGYSDRRKDPTQVALVANNSQKLVDFFAGMGVYFNTRQVNPTDGSPVNRGHAISPDMGVAFATMYEYAKKIGLDIRFSTNAQSFIIDGNGQVVGVNCLDYYGRPVEYRGNKIVLATGGWSSNRDMIVKYWGAPYRNLINGGIKGMDGVMLNAAVSQLDADLVDMDFPHPDVSEEVNKGILLTTNLLRSAGGILVRQSTGQRFSDEQGNHSEIAAAAMHELGDEYFWEICGEGIFQFSEAVAQRARSYVDMGLTIQYDSIEAMAGGIGVDVTTLKETIDDYNAAVRGEKADRFGRQRFYIELKAPFYVLKVANGVSITAGGLKVDEEFRVINKNGNPIPSLYAVGEISGGYRIAYAGGDSNAHSSISGMLIGEQLTKK